MIATRFYRTACRHSQKKQRSGEVSEIPHTHMALKTIFAIIAICDGCLFILQFIIKHQAH